MRLREREWCTSHEAWEDGDKRYPGNEVDLEHNDYDVMCLDKMQYEKLLFYISLSFCFWVRSRFCFVFLVWGFVFPFRDYLSVSGFGFSILLVCFFLGFCTSISGFWVFVLYYGHQGKLSVFLKLFHDAILYFLILVLVLPFRNLCFCFGFWFSFLGFVVCIFLIGHHIFDRRLSVNLSTRGNLTRLSISWQSSQIGKRLNYLRI